jgi:hypothetical protein
MNDNLKIELTDKISSQLENFPKTSKAFKKAIKKIDLEESYHISYDYFIKYFKD